MRRLPLLASGIAALLVASTAACAAPPVGQPVPTLERAMASQEQATPDFDEQTYRIEDADAIDDLAAIVIAHGAYGDQLDETVGAPGARSTLVTYRTTDDDAVTIAFTLHDDASAFQQEIDGLVAQWRESGEHAVATEPWPPGPSSAPPPPSSDAAIASALAVQSDGPLGDGTDGIERDDAASLDALAAVLALPVTEPEDIECAWSTRTTVTVSSDDGTAETVTAASCGATGRDEALGHLVAEWALDEA